jgi:hypothetical protein
VSDSVGSVGNPNFIFVHHGNMTINVPRAIFKGRTAKFQEPEAGSFFRILQQRYPWLTKGAIEVIKREAKASMMSVIEVEESPVDRASRLYVERQPTRAMVVIEDHLRRHPRDVDALHLKGRLLFDLGRREEAYHCFAMARSISQEHQERHP